VTVDNKCLRSIPKIDEILNEPAILETMPLYGKSRVLQCVRKRVEEIRQEFLSGRRNEPVKLTGLIESIRKQLIEETRMHLKPVINGTGIVLHTNLGRAVLSEAAAKAAYRVARQYTNLEYDCETGQRGSRYDHVEGLLKELCHCESAMVVNNNAAAVLLILGTLSKNREAIVSRGELVEIGGAFRVPEVMEQSGAILVEVGTTNKTRISDYEKAISQDATGVLLKVHTSNFKIMGFTEEVDVEALADLGNKYQVPVVYDLGSGSLFNPEACHLGAEPHVRESVEAGADLICFSGDKLLGGPQAGIIIGKKIFLDQLKKNPLTRALRVDKMTLAALEATLKHYQDEEKVQKEVPLLAKLAITEEELREKAKTLMFLLEKRVQIKTEMISEWGQVGGGSMPNQMLPSICVVLQVDGFSANQLDQQLHRAEIPIVGRIRKDQFLLDMRTVETEELELIAQTLGCLLEKQEKIK
jgi:L-seryl-tRNA(Ser) seleniumtransferase